MPSCPFFLISREEQPLNFFYSFFFQGIASEIPQAAGVLTAAIVPYHTIPFHTIVSHACRFLFLESAHLSQALYSTLLYSPQIQSKPKHNDSQQPTKPTQCNKHPSVSKPPSFLPIHPITSRHAKTPRPSSIHQSIKPHTLHTLHATYDKPTKSTKTITRIRQISTKKVLPSPLHRPPPTKNHPSIHPYPKKGGLLYLPHRHSRRRYSSRDG